MKERVQMVEVPKGECKFCGAVKECIKFKYKDKFFILFDTEEELMICETCLSHAFRKLKKEY